MYVIMCLYVYRPVAMNNINELKKGLLLIIIIGGGIGKQYVKLYQ